MRIILVFLSFIICLIGNHLVDVHAERMWICFAFTISGSLLNSAIFYKEISTERA